MTSDKHGQVRVYCKRQTHFVVLNPGRSVCVCVCDCEGEAIIYAVFITLGITPRDVEETFGVNIRPIWQKVL